ncbi:MAG: hypothetical protein V4726_22145 [Verrucomicrobiota bacterium]
MRWMLYAGLATVFVLGGVAGGLLGVTAERDRMKKLERSAPGLAGELMGRRLETELKLDPEQARRVRQIYATARPQLQQLDRERRQKMRQIMDTTHPQILELLNPQQKERFQRLQKQLRQRLRLRDPDSTEPAPGSRKKPVPAAEIRL